MPLSSVLFDFKFSVNCEFGTTYLTLSGLVPAVTNCVPSSGQGSLFRVSQNASLSSLLEDFLWFDVIYFILQSYYSIFCCYVCSSFFYNEIGKKTLNE